MTANGRLDSAPVAELRPEDQALLDELLPEHDERSGPARRRSHASSDVIVFAVLDAALAAQERAETEAVEIPRAVSGVMEQPYRLGMRSGRRPLVLLAASLALFSVGALAATVLIKVALAPKPAPISAPARPAAPVVETPITAEEPVTTMEPVTVAAPTVGKVRPPRHKHVRASPRVAARQHFVAEVDLSSAQLEDLLALANTLRRNREWQSADEVYKTVIDRFPGTDAAVVAQVVSGTLHVNQFKDAPGALERYRLALVERPMGALAEEARWGVAVALRAMSDREGELKALHEFVDRHGASALAPAARRRIAELGQ